MGVGRWESARSTWAAACGQERPVGRSSGQVVCVCVWQEQLVAGARQWVAGAGRSRLPVEWPGTTLHTVVDRLFAGAVQVLVRCSYECCFADNGAKKLVQK